MLLVGGAGPWAAAVWAIRPVRIKSRMECQGVVRAVEPGWVTVDDAQGRRAKFQLQAPQSVGVLVGGAKPEAVVRFPCEVRVRGTVAARRLPVGARVVCLANIDLGSKRTLAPVARLRFDDGTHLGMKWPSALQTLCEVRGVVAAVHADSLDLRTTDDAETVTINVTLKRDAVAEVQSRDTRWIRVGDRVESLAAVHFDSGEWVVQTMHVQLSRLFRPPPPGSMEPSFPLPAMPPRDLRSTHFVLHTDLPTARAQRLLHSLERIWGTLQRHFGEAPKSLIECYVIRDMSRWQAKDFDATAWAQMKAGAGVTVTDRWGDQVRSVVYACDQEKVVRHEVVHAFCAQTFGDTGPTWYAEGLAEWGSYEEQRYALAPKAVVVDPIVTDYLRASSPRSLHAVVAEHQGTGDSWQAYSWRWAACQMLAANPNYSSRFPEYGRALMSGGERISLAGYWGLDSHRADFEYRQFVRHVGVGYDIDLCAWNWDVSFRELPPQGRAQATVQARRGWQPSGVRVLQGETYEYAAIGQWRVDQYREAVSANGMPHGEGRLCATVLDDQLQLGAPFALGKRGDFIAPQSGRLYLRCLDGWTQLNDNAGYIQVHLREKAE